MTCFVASKANIRLRPISKGLPLYWLDSVLSVSASIAGIQIAPNAHIPLLAINESAKEYLVVLCEL